MHEYAIAQHLVNLVENQAQLSKANKVLAVNLVLGEQSHVQTESLEQYFEMLTEAKENVAHGAEIYVRRSPMWFYCAHCKLEYPWASGDFACPACAELGQLIDAGDELSLESIEIRL